MTDAHEPPPAGAPEAPKGIDELQAALEAADAADAPSIAEELATQLAATLDGDDEGATR